VASRHFLLFVLNRLLAELSQPVPIFEDC